MGGGRARGAGRRGVAHVSDGHGKCSFRSSPVPKAKSWNLFSHVSTYGTISPYEWCVFAMLWIAAAKMWVGVLSAGHSNLLGPVGNSAMPPIVTLFRAIVIIPVST